MFDEQQLPLRAQDALDFPEHTFRVVDSAQDERRNNGVHSQGARMTTAYARVGRSGDFGGTYFLTRLVGRSRARELYFTGDTITAAEAQAIGLVDHVHPPEELPAPSALPRLDAADDGAAATPAAGDCLYLCNSRSTGERNLSVSSTGDEFPCPERSSSKPWRSYTRPFEVGTSAPVG